jgi:uncharacterized protein (DUF608 family)
MALFGLSVHTSIGTDFYALSASSLDNARAMAGTFYGAIFVEILDLEELINEQYDGFATLCTS